MGKKMNRKNQEENWRRKSVGKTTPTVSRWARCTDSRQLSNCRKLGGGRNEKKEGSTEMDTMSCKCTKCCCILHLFFLLLLFFQCNKRKTLTVCYPHLLGYFLLLLLLFVCLFFIRASLSAHLLKFATDSSTRTHSHCKRHTRGSWNRSWSSFAAKR